VEEIADAAAISPRTFFRYFPSKEDVVIWDEYDPLALDLLGSRTDDEPLAEALRAVIRETLGGLYRRDPERLLARVCLSVTVPELRARLLNEQTQGVELVLPMLAKKRGAAVDELSLRVIGTALLAAVTVAIDLWQRATASAISSPSSTRQPMRSPRACTSSMSARLPPSPPRNRVGTAVPDGIKGRRT
jgi:AcrR family transcriptional regulator